MDFNSEHVRLFYRLLNHKEETELRFIKRGAYPTFQVVKDEEDFREACLKWNGKRNIYAVLRDRRPGLKECAKASDIIGVQTVVLDVDPIREAEIPATDEELLSAIKASEKMAQYFEREGFRRPFRAMTGNGVCLYFSLPFLEITQENREDISRNLELFESRMRKVFKDILREYSCRLDSMFDLPRLGKVIGTLSVKGENTPQRPRRLSYWIEEPVERRVDKKLLTFILEEKNKIEEATDTADPNKPGAVIPAFNMPQLGPIWLIQPIPYFGEKLEGEWIWEPKIDGWRMQVIKNADNVEFWGRRLERKPNWTERLKVIPQSSLENLPSGVLLDCELQSDQGRRLIPSLFAAKPKAKPIVYVFDLIFWQGKFIGNLPLKERKTILHSIDFREPFFLLQEEPVSNLEEHLKKALSESQEGIVIKELNSPYLIGQGAPMVSLYWRKIKGR